MLLLQFQLELFELEISAGANQTAAQVA